MNVVILSGNLGQDPEIRIAQSGNTVASFSLAVRRKVQKDGEDISDWFNCTAFGKKAEFCEKYLHKGSRVMVVGEIQNNNYEDKNGTKHYSNQVIISNIEFGESKKASEQNTESEPTTPSSKPAFGKSVDEFMNIPDSIDEELPFS